MNQYQFESILRKMERTYGHMLKGEEEQYNLLLFPMESNLLKVHRAHPESNSRRLKEAILLALHYVDGRIRREEADLAKFESEENGRLKVALLMSFDPFTNEEVKEALSLREDADLSDFAFLQRYYDIPVRCMMRILESVEHWEKLNGSDGYFVFTENYMGAQIPRDDKMNFSVLV